MELRKLALFADYTCPFCRLAEAVASRLEAEAGADIERVPFELRPPGTPLPPLDDPQFRDAFARAVEPIARELGVDMTFTTLATRTRKAHEAVAHAHEHDAGAIMHAALYDAYWKDARDIGRIDVLVEIGREIGLDPGGLRVALDIDQWTADVVARQSRGRELGLRGLPAWIATDAGAAEDTATGRLSAARVRIGLLHHDELKEWVEE